MKQPLVSVIIPTYNRAGYIAEALDSVFAQSFTDFEVIVVDDGSTDGTEKVLEPYLGRIRFFRQDNSGVSAARNRGVAMAEGRYVAFLDSDDSWYPQKLAAQMDILVRNPEFPVIHSDSSVIDEKGRMKTLAANPTKQPRNGMVFEEFFLSYRAVINTSSLLLKKECFVSCGGFDESLKTAEDYNLSLRLAWTHPIWFINQPLVRTRLTQGSLSRGALAENVARREAVVRRWLADRGDFFAYRPELARRKWQGFNHESAFMLYYAGEFSVSRRYFRRLLRTWPRAWLYYGLTLLPGRLLHRLRRMKTGT